MIEFHSIGSMLILLISNVKAFVHQLLNNVSWYVVHGTLKWVIKHVEC